MYMTLATDRQDKKNRNVDLLPIMGDRHGGLGSVAALDYQHCGRGEKFVRGANLVTVQAV